MPLREAIAFLGKAVARKPLGGAVGQYTFHEGVMYARNTAVLAAYPVDHIRGTFGLSADDLDGAVNRMPMEPTIAAGDGTLILRAAGLRSTIDLLAADPPTGAPEDGANWMQPADGLRQAIATALPFTAAEGTWQRSVQLVDGAVRALSNPHGCAVDVPGMEIGEPVALPDDAASFLAGLPAQPDAQSNGWLRYENALVFRWPSGAWARCQLMAQPWPRELVDNIFAAAETECPVAVTDEWRDAFSYVRALGDGTVDIDPDCMMGRSLHAEHRAELTTGVVRGTRWSIKALVNVLAVAEAWDPDATGMAAFRGKGLRGVAAGMSRR